MDTLGAGQRLPRLENEDFLEAGIDLIIDANVRTAFLELQATNPHLSRQLLLAAHYDQQADIEHLTITDTLRGHINIVKAIERALQREATVERSSDDDEGSQPSGGLLLDS